MTATLARTFGTLSLGEAEGYGDRKPLVWEIQAEPHVVMRVKRLFPRAQQTRKGVIEIHHTPDVARDIEWIISRYPLDADEDTAGFLQESVERADATRGEIDRILTGTSSLSGDDWLDPVNCERRDYQYAAADVCIASSRLLVVDELGLGKSLTGMLLLRNPDARPALVVAPTHLPRQWLGMLNRFFPTLRGHIITTGSVYDPAKKREMRGHDPDVLIISYSKLIGWADHLAGRVKSVIFDEMQELRRSESQKYGAACMIADGADYRMGLTGTPVYNHGGEIFNVMEVLEQGALGSRGEFSREWGAAGSNGKVMVDDPAALGTFLREQGLMIRRTRKDVGRELPAVTTVVHTVDSDPDALEDVQDDVRKLAEIILASNDRKEVFTASGDLDWKLRQATGIAKAPYAAEFIRLLLESEEKVCVFGWHRAVYDIWVDRLREFNPVLYTGTESPTQKQLAINRFLGGQVLADYCEAHATERERKFDEAYQGGTPDTQCDPFSESQILIMSLRSGAGVDGLQDVCSVPVFGELDWSPGVHDQCIGRFNRDGMDTDHPVVAYYLVSDEGSDPLVAETLGIKRQQMDGITDPDGKLFAAVTDTGDRIKRLARQALDRPGASS